MSHRVSVIINTCDRAASLRETLAGLQAGDPASIEVVVVIGPCTDDTEAVLAQWHGQIKIGRCPTRNLSRSRNIGIRLAAGDVAAFIDDDAVPDAAWLKDLLPLFDDLEVAAVGGPVFNHTGARLQAHYIVADRFGAAQLRDGDDNPTLLNHPMAELYPSTLGTNSLFRRETLVAIGGFDEEYEYFLDETDVCVRLVDAGYKVVFGRRGWVYHRYLPSSVRNASKAISNWYPVLKNKAYFAARHAADLLGASAIQKALDAYAVGIRHQTEWHVEQGHLPLTALAALDRAVAPATAHGFRRAAMPRVSSVRPLHADPELPWRRFPLTADGLGRRLHLCFVSQDFPPGVVSGIARVSHELAAGLAARGHVVRAIVRAADGQHTVDWEDGVWVHRVPDAPDPELPPGNPCDLPDNIWRRSVAVLRELERIETMRPIDLVQAPNWDCEGLATILDGRWRTVLGVYTPMICAVASNLEWQLDADLQRRVLRPIIAGEVVCYRQASAILACGPSIVRRIEADYAVQLDDRPIGLVPHGLPDLGGAPPPPADREWVEILFVGRLELRKGIDLLLGAVPLVCAQLPKARFVIAGDDSLTIDGGKTFRQRFEQDPANTPWRDRVNFLGPVSDAELDALYRRCDLVVVPSRFESFGLPLIEAMMRARPVIATAAGGMAEIIEVDGNGLLTEPENIEGLAAAIRRLVVSATDRHAFGARSRDLFLERYERSRMIQGATAFYAELLGYVGAAIEQA
jgi:glycosyltransferase involved in cell wall biosynthesis/GT2 family glycosyltransferase